MIKNVKFPVVFRQIELEIEGTYQPFQEGDYTTPEVKEGFEIDHIYAGGVDIMDLVDFTYIDQMTEEFTESARNCPEKRQKSKLFDQLAEIIKPISENEFFNEHPEELRR